MLRKKECVAMLLAGGQGSRLYALTNNIAKPAVAFTRVSTRWECSRNTNRLSLTSISVTVSLGILTVLSGVYIFSHPIRQRKNPLGSRVRQTRFIRT